RNTTRRPIRAACRVRARTPHAGSRSWTPDARAGRTTRRRRAMPRSCDSPLATSRIDHGCGDVTTRPRIGDSPTPLRFGPLASGTHIARAADRMQAMAAGFDEQLAARIACAHAPPVAGGKMARLMIMFLAAASLYGCARQIEVQSDTRWSGFVNQASVEGNGN